MRLLISDANILIDMQDGRLVETLFQLPYRFMVPDLLFYDELEGQHGNLLNLGLELGELTPAGIADAEAMVARYTGPSRYDCLALALARQEQCPLITGDRALHRAAQQEAVSVVGTLWLVEKMVMEGLITTTDARTAYQRMREAGSRLPWGEAEHRLKEVEQGTFALKDPFLAP